MPIDKPPKGTITLEQAAARLGINRSKMGQHLSNGLFPTAYRGRLANGDDGPWRIPLKAVIGAADRDVTADTSDSKGGPE